MSAFTPQQWAAAGEYACRAYCAEFGTTPTDAQVIEARVAALVIACGDPDSQQDSPQ